MTGNYCVNCYFFRKSDICPDDTNLAVCGATGVTNPVSGKKKFTYCTVERMESINNDRCGIEGINYVDREEHNNQFREWQNQQDTREDDQLSKHIREGSDPF